MKNKKIIFAGLICGIFLSGCGSDNVVSNNTDKKQIEATTKRVSFNNKVEQSTEDEQSTENESALNQEDKKVLYIGKEADYRSTKPEDLFKDAKVVIKGKKIKDVSCYVADNSLPVQQVEIEVQEVCKGEGIPDKIIIGYYGGEVPFNEYAKTLDKEEIKKEFPDYNEEKYKNVYIGIEDSDENVKLEDDESYMLFLANDSDSKGNYFVLADGYGARKMKDGKLYDFNTNDYIEFDFNK